ncbi:hypothetical protein V2W30_21245 [Streptomyces sp. Q6]|uniref:Uncharacterized protein n=1 Tax=Streptomyces citrinus TaxID=3118173 RepID=A0ACD5AEG6_9ACTN
MSLPGRGPDDLFKKSERGEQGEQHEQHEQGKQDEHAGNATVNDGPRRPADAAADDASGPDTLGATGLGSDELALRRMMRQAVREIEPADEVLDHLRRAVPARRARKRQAAVGAVAAGVFVAMAVPAVLHVTSSGAAGDRPWMAGSSSKTHGGVDAGKGSDGAGAGSPSASQGKDGDGKKGDKGKASGGATAGTDPASTAAASSPVCAANELGQPVPSVSAPDGSGTVYGTFRVTNVSNANCTIDSPGSVSTIAQGAADPAKVGVIDHTSGDPATGLPDPSTEPSQLILEPGMAYEVKFAWVPSASCPSTGGGSSGGDSGSGGGDGSSGGDASPTPTPTPTPTGDTATSTGDSTDSGLSTQLGHEDTADGSIVVSHTPEPGSPVVTAKIPDACAGTLYRTGILPAS